MLHAPSACAEYSAEDEAAVCNHAVPVLDDSASTSWDCLFGRPLVGYSQEGLAEMENGHRVLAVRLVRTVAWGRWAAVFPGDLLQLPQCRPRGTAGAEIAWTPNSMSGPALFEPNQQTQALPALLCLHGLKFTVIEAV